MMMRSTVSIVFLGCFVLLSMVRCDTNKLQCSGDRYCIENVGADFLCVRGTCVNQKDVELPAEPKPEPRPEPPPTPDAGPEPVVPDTPVIPDPVVKDEGTPEPDRPAVEQKKLHQPCSQSAIAPPGEQCGPGLICRREGVRSYCFQDCSSNTTVCQANQDGRNDCRVIGWERSNTAQPIRICVKPRKEGESCDPLQSLYCETGGQLVCQKGTCTKGKVCDTVGCSCEDKAGQPPTICDVTKKLICDPSSKQCALGFRAYEGMPCGLIKGATFICTGEDLVCVCPFGSSCTLGSTVPRICHKKCDLKNPLTSCSPRKGFVCTKNGNTNEGFCTQDTCETQHDCLYQDYPHTCTGTSATDKTCRPFPNPGTVKFGEKCNISTGATCEHPLVCLRGSGGDGYCSVQCVNNDPVLGDALCGRLGAGATCSLSISTIRVGVCGWTCRNGERCPNGFTCSNNICLR